MKKLKSILGHGGGVLTVALAVISPFLLFGWFQAGIGSMGLRIHPSFSGGDVARTVARSGYQIRVYQPVGRTTRWQRIEPFVQLEWTPVSALPESVTDDIDLDGDSAPDVRVTFSRSKLTVDTAPLNERYRAMHSDGVSSFSSLIARVNDGIVVRLPLK